MDDTTQQAPANSVATYRTRPIEVQAIQFLGEENCEEVFAFLGLRHSDDAADHTWIEGVGETNSDAEISNWIVCDADGTFEVFTNEEFHVEFEAATDAR